ncbi:hypothetical protein T484DRAFT_3650312, partial [Baffinella frigidus]
PQIHRSPLLHEAPRGAPSHVRVDPNRTGQHARLCRDPINPKLHKDSHPRGKRLKGDPHRVCVRRRDAELRGRACDTSRVFRRNGRGQWRDGALELDARGEVLAHGTARAASARERVIVMPERVRGRRRVFQRDGALELDARGEVLAHGTARAARARERVVVMLERVRRRRRGGVHGVEESLVVGVRRPAGLNRAVHLGIRRGRLLLRARGAHVRPPQCGEHVVARSCRRRLLFGACCWRQLRLAAHFVGRENLGRPGERILHAFDEVLQLLGVGGKWLSFAREYGDVGKKCASLPSRRARPRKNVGAGASHRHVKQVVHGLRVCHRKVVEVVVHRLQANVFERLRLDLVKDPALARHLDPALARHLLHARSALSDMRLQLGRHRRAFQHRTVGGKGDSTEH